MSKRQSHLFILIKNFRHPEPSEGSLKRDSSAFGFRMTFFISLAAVVIFKTHLSAQEIPFVTADMRTPAYWIQRQTNPDQVMLDSPSIQAFNQNIQDKLKLTKDIFAWPDVFSGEPVRKEIEKVLNDFEGKVFYFMNDQKGDQLFFDRIKENLNLVNIPHEIKPRYGIAVQYTNLRFFPTKEPLLEKPGDVDFDQLQNSALNVGDPVGILHESKDGEWFYVETETLSGWVKKKDTAIGKKDLMETYSQCKAVIVTAPKTQLFQDRTLSQVYDFAQMGTRFCTVQLSDPDLFPINFFSRHENGEMAFSVGYMKKEDAHEGYLPYTRRNILNQAFKLLDKPYGWGGMKGEQDCSRFLQEVFDTVGVRLPRNSSEQGQVGKLIAEFTDEATDAEKIQVLKNRAVGGLTLLKMKGHIMLYLGMIDNRPYAIHATWGYRKPKADGEDEVCVLNRVVVSDLSLGEGSKKGSLLKRITTVRAIDFDGL